MSPSRTQTLNKNKKPLLYWLVFEASFVKWLTIFLFAFFVLNPVVPVFAADEEAAETTGSTDEAPAASLEPVDDTPEVEPTADEDSETEKKETETSTTVTEEDETTDAEDNQEDETDDENQESASNPEPTEESSAKPDSTKKPKATSTPISDTTENSDESDTNKGTTTPVSNETTASSTVPDTNTSPGTTSGGTAATSSSATSTASTTDPTSATSTATSTDPVVEETPPVEEPVTPEPHLTPEPIEEAEEELNESTATTTASSSDAVQIVYITNEMTNDENRHTFGVNQCVSVGNGSYYCHEATSSRATIGENAVYAAPDAEGDHEIYLRLNGEVEQITYNNYDDRAPYYDAPAEQIVFHRLLEGRYQVFQYDLGLETETQLTDTRENSMEPTQADGVTVWQEWVEDNWEIAALIDGEIKLLSENMHNDVAPSVRDDYIMWHTMDTAGNKQLSVYEIKTGQTTLVSDPEGGQVSNPRFVLVYDTTFDNGDTVTKTYDPETGAVTPVGSNPAPLPKLPDPEPGGETSALIGTKTNPRGEVRGENNEISTGTTTSNNTVSSSTDPAVTATSSATTTETSAIADLDLNASSSSEVLPLTDFDLIVEPFGSSSSAHQTDSASTSDSVE